MFSPGEEIICIDDSNLQIDNFFTGPSIKKGKVYIVDCIDTRYDNIIYVCGINYGWFSRRFRKLIVEEFNIDEKVPEIVE